MVSGMRVVAVAGPDPGHLFPMMAMATALHRRGHDVAVITSREWRDEVEASGLGFDGLPRLGPEGGDEDLAWRMWGRAQQMAHPFAEVLGGRNADLVVADTLVAGAAFGAELAGIPWVELIPHFLWEPSRALPPIGLGQRPARTVVGRLLERQQRRLQAASVAEGRAHRGRVRTALGLSGDGAPAVRLVATLPDLEPPRPDWPRRTFVAGALEWEPPGWSELPVPQGSGPLAVITDSTVPDMKATVVRDAVTGLAGEGIRLVVTSDAALGDTSGIVVGRGPHGPLLDGAACAVGPGGHGFVSKALARGVPLVLVPQQGDQRETAARVERAGAAVTLAPEAVSPERLRRAVGTVLDDPAFRSAAEGIAARAAGLGPRRAAALVDRFATPHASGSGVSVPTS